MVLPVVKLSRAGRSTVVKWNSPKIPQDIKEIFNQEEAKEDVDLNIEYRILYKTIEDKQNDDEWNEMSMTKENQCDMYAYYPCDVRVQYVINHCWYAPYSSISITE